MQCLSGNNTSNKRNIIKKVYQKLGLESLKSRCWFRKLCHFYKILNENSPSYLFDLIPNLDRVHQTRHSNNIPAIHTRHNYFNNSFNYFKNSFQKVSIFKKNLLNFIRPCANSIFNIHNPYGIKLLTRLQLCLSHPCDHKFRHCFQDTLNPLCDCGNDIETTTHFFLQCPSFHTPRQTLLSNI